MYTAAEWHTALLLLALLLLLLEDDAAPAPAGGYWAMGAAACRCPLSGAPMPAAHSASPWL
jgi:hypothetical protein